MKRAENDSRNGGKWINVKKKKKRKGQDFQGKEEREGERGREGACIGARLHPSSEWGTARGITY